MLHFLAGTWMIWLFFAVILALVAIMIMFVKMGRAWKSQDFHSPFAGILPAFIAGILATANTILFVIGVIAAFLGL